MKPAKKLFSLSVTRTKNYLFAAAAAFLITGLGNIARSQEQKEPGDKQDNKLEEYDEIIIRKKSDNPTDKKMTIEINGDEVTVNGKPLDDYIDDDISVRLRNAKRFKLAGPPSQFRNQQDWSWQSDDQEHGKETAFLGVATEGSSGGAKIVTVAENSAAEKAGLQKGDIITKVNDSEVFDHEQLSGAIAKMKPGDNVTITFKREGKEKKTTAKLGKREAPARRFSFPNIPGAPGAPGGPVPPGMFNFDGGDLQEFFNQHMGKPRLGIKAQDMEEGKGVKVLEVEDGSPAEKAGIKEDDIITSFEGKEVNSVEELSKASRDTRDRTSLKVQLKRKGKSQTITIQIPKKLKTAEL